MEGERKGEARGGVARGGAGWLGGPAAKQPKVRGRPTPQRSRKRPGLRGVFLADEHLEQRPALALDPRHRLVASPPGDHHVTGEVRAPVPEHPAADDTGAADRVLGLALKGAILDTAPRQHPDNTGRKYANQRDAATQRERERERARAMMRMLRHWGTKHVWSTKHAWADAAALGYKACMEYQACMGGCCGTGVQSMYGVPSMHGRMLPGGCWWKRAKKKGKRKKNGRVKLMSKASYRRPCSHRGTRRRANPGRLHPADRYREAIPSNRVRGHTVKPSEHDCRLWWVESWMAAILSQQGCGSSATATAQPQSQHSHSTVTAQSQHSRSTAQSQARCGSSVVNPRRHHITHRTNSGKTCDV